MTIRSTVTAVVACLAVAGPALVSSAGATPAPAAGGTSASPSASYSPPTEPSSAPSRLRVASGWKPRPARYGVHKTTDVVVRMSDGVRLRVDIFRPARADGRPAPGRFPVILTQTPYNKNIPRTNFLNEYLVRRGYVQVIADVRGTGSSEGSWSSFGPREQRDGAQLVRWVHSRKRPWSSGDVGLYGVSYGAINQFFTAAQQPRGLKAIFPIVPAGDVYRDVAASGGALDAGFIPFWLGAVTATSLVPPAYTAVAPNDGLITLLQHAGGAFAFQLPTLTGAVTGSDVAYDGPFYRSRSPLSVVDRVRVPAMVFGGEYDLFQRGEPMLADRLRRNGVPTRFVFGPWNHIQAGSAPGLAKAGIGTIDELALRWFDRYVRGTSDRALMSDVKPVTYYEIGSGRWRTAPRWMPRSVRAETLQLDGDATSQTGVTPWSPGRLRFGPVTGSGVDYVPQHPVAGLCSRSASQWTAGLAAVPGCETDNRLNDATGTSYQTAPLARPLRIMGPINAKLFVSSTRQDGLLSVHVEDVAPDGSVDRITGGWQMLSHRALDRSRSLRRDGEILRPWHPFTRAAQSPVTPGEVMGVDVEIFPTGAVIKKGHRLRITVQQMDVPHLAPTVPQLFDSLGGVVSIHHSPTYRSRLIIPVRR